MKLTQAFVLGAGLGTRLRPLTASRPKPLIPIRNKPLITFAFDHLRASGVSFLAVNTHHLPEVYDRLLDCRDGIGDYHGSSVHLRNEPILLETGGGIAAIRSALDDTLPFMVYNGDVLCDAPLDHLIECHFREQNLATLLLRSSGGPLQVQCDPGSGLVQDIRQYLGTSTAPSFLFSGIYLLDPEIFSHIPTGEVISIVPLFLKLISEGKRIGGVIEDRGRWFDLGTQAAYRETNRLFSNPEATPTYPLAAPLMQIHPTSHLPATCQIDSFSSIGAHSQIGEKVRLENTVIWDHVSLAPGSSLTNCIVLDGQKVDGHFEDRVI